MIAVSILAALLTMQISGAVAVRGGTVTGRVLSAEGKPAVGIRVFAMSVAPNVAIPAGEIALVSLAETDNAGKYQLTNVPSGRYYIAAGRLQFPTFYPGVANQADARVVVVAEGVTPAGIDFSLTGPLSFRTSGQVRGVPLSVPPGWIRVSLRPTEFGVGPQMEVGTTGDGRFEFSNVPPGDYLISLPLPISASTAVIRISNKDVSGIEIAAPPLVFGRVVMEDGTNLPPQASGSGPTNGPNPATLLRLATRAITTPARCCSSDYSVVFGDGSFIVPLAAADHQIGMDRLPFGFYVKSMSYGNVDLLKESLRIGSVIPTLEMRVVLTTTTPASMPPGVTVSGRVSSVAADAPRQPRWIRIQTSGPRDRSFRDEVENRISDIPIRDDGTFEIARVPPGAMTLQVLPNDRLGSVRIIVADRDLSGIDLEALAAADLNRLTTLPLLANDPLTLIQTLPGYRASPIGCDHCFGRVGGRLTGGPPWPSTIHLVFTGTPARLLGTAVSSGADFKTEIRADGTFEFPPIPIGPYSVRISPSGRGSMVLATISVGELSDLSNIQLAIPAPEDSAGKSSR